MRKNEINIDIQNTFSESKDMHYGALPLVFQKAEKLRNEMTPSEELLWNYLRSNQWGYKFRRQHPLFNVRGRLLLP